MLDEEPDGDPHGECTAEIDWLQAEVKRLRAIAAKAKARQIAEHIEQRLRMWRQQQMNRSGDRLALDDFMNEGSIADLVDFVCDEQALDAAMRDCGEAGHAEGQCGNASCFHKPNAEINARGAAASQRGTSDVE